MTHHFPSVPTAPGVTNRSLPLVIRPVGLLRMSQTLPALTIFTIKPVATPTHPSRSRHCRYPTRTFRTLLTGNPALRKAASAAGGWWESTTTHEHVRLKRVLKRTLLMGSFPLDAVRRPLTGNFCQWRRWQVRVAPYPATPKKPNTIHDSSSSSQSDEHNRDTER